MKKLLPLLLLASTLFVSTARAADGDITVYNSKNELYPEWIAAGWGKLTVEKSDKGGRTTDGSYVSSKVSPDATPYCGISFQVDYSKDALTAGIPLSADLLANGLLEMYLNTGAAWPGSETGSASVKVIMTFVTKSGDKISAFDEDVPELDNDASSWEQIKIPIALMLTKLEPSAAGKANDIVGIASISVQYKGQPTCEVKVADMVIHPK